MVKLENFLLEYPNEQKELQSRVFSPHLEFPHLDFFSSDLC